MQISVAVLNAVSKFASKETGRPYLNQVVVREGELMACDGYHLVRVHVAPMVGFSVGPGSKIKAGGVIGLPYLDGVQYAAVPAPRTPK